MAVEPGAPPEANTRTRYLFLSAAGIVAVLICLLVLQLFCRFHYQQGLKSLDNNNLTRAQASLEKARAGLAPAVFQNDRKRLAVAEGDLIVRQAGTAGTVTLFLQGMEGAEIQYREALAIDPLNIDGHTGLAIAVAALEKIFPFVHRRPFPTKALPIFERLLALMPANLYTHTLLTKYYYDLKMTDELNAIVGRSISLYPPLYYQLKQQPFYTMAMNGMLKESLQTAIDTGVYVDEAYRALADLAQQEDDYPTAIGYFLQTRPKFQYRDNSGYDLQLGSLYLKNKQFAEAEQAFLAALKTKGQDKRLNEIWAQYLSRKQYNAFLNFCKKIPKDDISEMIEILQAKCLIEMGQYELATSHLIRINSADFAAESLHLQGRIAELQKNWDIMELRSQRATVLDPGNSGYHLQFSRALQNQQKWPQAEKAASDAINSADKPNPWLYNHRAWIRWNRKNYSGAGEDWEKAIKTSPATADFYSNMALVYAQGENISEAIRHLKKAITLKPDEQSYRKRLGDLENKLQAQK